MSTRDRATPIIALAASLLISGGAWAQTVGFVAGTQGDVEIRADGATSWAASSIDQNVSVGDTIRTGPDSAVKILLADETILTLGEDTELKIDEYVIGDAATRDPSALELLRGKARVFVGEAFGGPTRVEMYTPTAVIGVKGTGFEAYITEDPRKGKWTLVCHLDGGIFVRSRDESTDPRVVIPKDGLCSQVFQDHAPSDLVPRPSGFAPIQAPAGPSGPVTAGLTDQGVVEPPAVGPGGSGPGPGPGNTPAPGGIDDPGYKGLLGDDIVEQPPILPGAAAPQPPGPDPGANAPQP
jgi:hypothetical protein